MPEGKICYVEIPASSVGASAKFYADVFGWGIRARGDGAKAFDDTTGSVSGSWVAGRAPRSDAGVLFYIMVDSIPASIEKIVAGGGRAVTSRTPLGPGGEAYGTFLDPAGNLVGLYEERKKG